MQMKMMEKIKLLLLMNRKSQADLARELAITDTQVSKMLNYKIKMNFNIARKIAKLTGLDEWDLLKESIYYFETGKNNHLLDEKEENVQCD